MSDLSASSGWTLLGSALSGQRRAMLVLAAWSLLEMVPVLLSGQLIARAVDHGFLAGDLRTGITLLAGYGATMLLGAVGARQTTTPLATVVEGVRDHLVRELVRASLYRAVQCPDGTDGGTVARITRQAEGARQMVAALLMTVRTAGFSLLAAVTGILTLVPQVAWLTAGTLVLSGLLLTVLSPVLRRRYQAALAAEEHVATQAGAVLSGLRDVRACGATIAAVRQVGDAVDAHADAALSAARAGTGRIAVIALGARLPLVATFFIAPALVQSGAATAGQILGVTAYLVTGLEPALRSVVHIIGNMGLQLAVVLNRLARYAAMPSTPPQPDGTTTSFDVALRRAAFRYSQHSAPVLSELDLDIQYGDHLAVVGPSGIGKSTLANLIAGLQRHDAGEITLGGRSLAELAPSWLRRTVALIPQESYVFAGTLRENLCYLAAGNNAQLEAAVDELGLRPLVQRLGGYDTPFEHVEALSHGERQLITLARIYLSDARIVLLDEATCHLDARAEERVERAFLGRGGTLIVIAHRISSAIRARRVLVLDGTTVEIGDHATLLRNSPLYADLAGQWTATPV